MTMPGFEELQRRLDTFRQQTGGGLSGTVLIDRKANGLHLMVRMPEGGPVSMDQLVESLWQSLAQTCKHLGLTVKVSFKISE